jgi:hypothetical protein
MYKTWGGGGLPPERRLAGFLNDVHEAARRTLAGTFGFADLYEFLRENTENPALRQVVAALPNAATPRWSRPRRTPRPPTPTRSCASFRARSAW